MRTFGAMLACVALTACGGVGTGLQSASSGGGAGSGSFGSGAATGGGGLGGSGGGGSTVYTPFDATVKSGQTVPLDFAYFTTDPFPTTLQPRRDGSIAYSAATNTYTIRDSDGTAATFKEGTDALTGRTLQLLSYTAPPDVTSALIYSRGLAYVTSATAQTNIYGTAGTRTALNEQAAGIATYAQSFAAGRASARVGTPGFQLYNLANSTFALSIDFGRSVVTGTMSLVGTPLAGGADVPLATYTAGTTTALAGGGYSIDWRSSNPESFKTVGGYMVIGLYGPQAAEYGATYNLNDGFIVAAGIFGGKRQ